MKNSNMYDSFMIHSVQYRYEIQLSRSDSMYYTLYITYKLAHKTRKTVYMIG